MMTRAALVFALLLCACPPPPIECINGDEETCDAGSAPPDFCDSREDAIQDTVHCQLVVNDANGTERKSDVYISRLLDGGVDKDWYVAQMPTLTARSLLHVNGGYAGVQGTGVNFSMTVLKELADGGLFSIGSGIDKHGNASPKAIDLVVPFSESGARLFVLASDDATGAQTKVDNRTPYSVFVQVRDNPDSNEPNDTTPTVIPLTPGTAGASQGNTSGYLATNDDLDVYSFTVPAGGRKIIYIHLTGPMTSPPPTPLFGRLAYELFDPGMQQISTGQMDNDGLPIDLAIANLAAKDGVYTLKVHGYKAPNTTVVVKGDLTLKYDVAVQLLPDLDTNEPNDSFQTAKAVNPPPNSRTTLTGKLSYVPDEEWFHVTLSSRSAPSVLRWKMTVAETGGRFPPLSGVPARQLRVGSQVTLGPDTKASCVTNSTVCPKGFEDATGNQGLLVQDYCNNTSPTQCLLVQRNETPKFDKLKNMVGALPVQPNVNTELYFVFRDQGSRQIKYADDRDWTLELEWADDADEQSRVAGPTQVTLGGAPTASKGVLSFGYGKVLDPFDLTTGGGVRGPDDYDAWETDKDLFEFSYGGVMGDQNWTIEWELAHVDAGTVLPADIALELSFCTGAGPGVDGGLCAGEDRRIFAYSGSSLTPWYLPRSFGNATVLFDRKDVAGSTIITAKPVGCWCINSGRVGGGRFFANVAGINRLTNDPLYYTVRQSISPYPGSYTGSDGGPATCPVVDAGCGFAR